MAETPSLLAGEHERTGQTLRFVAANFIATASTSALSVLARAQIGYFS